VPRGCLPRCGYRFGPVRIHGRDATPIPKAVATSAHPVRMRKKTRAPRGKGNVGRTRVWWLRGQRAIRLPSLPYRTPPTVLRRNES
jgi:hypothetical protein